MECLVAKDPAEKESKTPLSPEDLKALVEAALKVDPKGLPGKHKIGPPPKAINPKQKAAPARNKRHGQGQPKGR